jgi:hypothetical protein
MAWTCVKVSDTLVVVVMFMGVVWCSSALTVEFYAGDVASMTVEGQDGVGICRLDVVELDCVMTGGGEVAFVRRDTQAVDLRSWVRPLRRSKADPSWLIRSRACEASQHTVERAAR